MHAVIVVNGPEATMGRWEKEVRAADLIVAADGGARNARRLGLRPHVVVGDSDSLDQDTAQWLEQGRASWQRHPTDKDESDLELALVYAAEAGATNISILGALGGRPDQTVANLQLLAHPVLAGRRVRMLGENYCLWLLRGGETARIEGRVGDTVSLLPLAGEAHGVRTAGLRWALSGDTLHFGRARGLSNEMTAPLATTSLERGLLLIVHLLNTAAQQKNEPGCGRGAANSPTQRAPVGDSSHE
jgi:thiamine pyrophosphokinase